MPLKQNRKLIGHRRLLEKQEDDPLSSVANLFDVAMVFAVALLLAMVSHFHLEDLLQSQDVTILKNPGTSKMEVIRRKGKVIEHSRISQNSIQGEGERLGTAYRLKTGQVVYVPETE